jgi:hypothetical protein
MANGFQGPPAVDFYSQLSGLGDVIAKNRADQAKRDAFAAATTPGPDGKIDYGRAILGLAQVDPASAALFAQRQNHEDTLKQQAIDNARAAANDTFNHGYQTSTLGIAKARLANELDETPTGFKKQADGTYAPLPGGPQDPTYQAKVAAETARAKGDQPTIIGAGSSVIIPNKATEGPLFSNRFGGTLSDDARDIKARQVINGDLSGLQNIGRGAQAGQTLEGISNRAAEILVNEYGMTPDAAAAHLGKKVQEFKASSMGQGAEARTAGVREANLNLILRAADAAIPAALDASEKVARTGWVPVNKVIQNGEVIASSPELKRFGMANLQLAEHWARAMNPTGVMRESDRDKALSFLSTADSKDTYRQAVDQLRTQITRERDAVKGAPVTPSAPSFRSDAVNRPLPDRSLWPRATNAAGNVLVLDPNRNMWVPENAQ